MPFIPTPDLIEKARTQHVPYEPPPPWTGHATSCAGGPSPGALALCTYLRAQGRVSNHCGGYECRQNSANATQASAHATGRALDVFPQTTADGNAVYAWLIEHAEALGLDYAIWNRTQWSSARGFTAYGGPNPHTDHIHLELTHAGAARETDFFRPPAPPPPSPKSRLGAVVVGLALGIGGKLAWDRWHDRLGL